MKENEKSEENQRENPLITVTVPVYNVSAYLRCCLNSIKEQSYQNLEILLIDDGSTDDSAKICREYCDQDPRFRLIQQENQGLGPARNTGLRNAKGKYICFVDADDCLHPDFVRILYENLITYEADLSICRFESYEGETPEDLSGETSKQNNEVLVLNQLGLLNALLKDDPVTTTVAWNKLIAVDWLNGFHFENKWHEDQFMINEYVRRCRKAVFTSAVLYEYRELPDSIMGKGNSMDLRHLDDLEAHRQRIWYFYRPKYRTEWENLFKADLETQLFWYTHFYNNKTAKLLKKQFYPSYAWSFRQYLLAGGLFRLNKLNLQFFIFRMSPRLYMFLKKLLKIFRD